VEWRAVHTRRVEEQVQWDGPCRDAAVRLDDACSAAVKWAISSLISHAIQQQGTIQHNGMQMAVPTAKHRLWWTCLAGVVLRVGLAKTESRNAANEAFPIQHDVKIWAAIYRLRSKTRVIYGLIAGG
jgi:hypothetical protein